MIFKNIFRRKGRTFLTLAGVAIGVAAMIALGALAGGLASGYQNMAGGSDADMVLSQADAYDPTMSVVDEHIGPELQAMPEVRDVVGTLMGNVSAADGAQYFFIFGHDPSGFAIEHFRVIRGEGLDTRGVRGRPLLLGKQAAEALEVDVDDTMQLTGGTFRVVGVYETGDALEDGGAVISLVDAQAILSKPRIVSAYYIQLKDTTLGDRLRARVERRYPDMSLSTATEFGDKQQMVDILKGMATAVAAMAIVVGGIAMTNTVLMSVFERTREIGVFRALGWRRRRILLLIMGESLVLAFVGALLGIAMGVGIVYGVRNVPLFGIIQGVFTVDLFIQAFVVALVLGLFGGLYPAWRASKMLPLEAMRYDGGGGTRRNGVLNFVVGGMTMKSLFRRKTRTALTLAAIGIGIGSVVGMGGLVEGFISELNGVVAGSNAHIMAIEAGVSDTGYSAIDEQVGARIAAHPDVAHVSGAVMWVVLGVDEVTFFIVFGYHPQEKAISRINVVEGSSLTSNRQILLGRATAEALHKRVGDKIRLADSIYRVVGIYESGVGYEEMGGVMTLRDAQMLAGKPRQVTYYAIEVKDPDKVDEVYAWLEDTFSEEIEISLTTEFAESLPDMAASEAMVNGLGVLMAMVGSVGMANTILMSVMERTREIGVLRAVGWSRGRVLGMIVKESVLLGGIGGLVGIGVGWLMMKGIGLIPSIGVMLGGSAISLPLMGQAMAVALVLGGLGGLYPAWRATKLSPVEALRYE